MPSTPSPEIPIPVTASSIRRNAPARQQQPSTSKRASDGQSGRSPFTFLTLPPARNAAKKFKCGFPGTNDCGFQSDQSEEVLTHIHNEHWNTVRTNQSSSSSSCTPPADLSSLSPASVTNGSHEFGDFSSSPASRSSLENGPDVTLSHNSVPITNMTSLPVFPGSNLLTTRTENVNVGDLAICPISPCRKVYPDHHALIQHVNRSHIEFGNQPSTSKASDCGDRRQQRVHSGSPDIPVVAHRQKMSVVQRESPYRYDDGSDIEITADTHERNGTKRSHRGSVLSTNDTGAFSSRRERASEERDPLFKLSQEDEKGKRRGRGNSAKDDYYPVDRQLRLRNGEKPKGPSKRDRLLARIQRVLLGNTNRNSLDDSDDSNSVGFSNEPFEQLRALASVLSEQAQEIPYEEPDESEEQVKRLTADRSEDGYEAKYQQRLQDNLGDSDEAYGALIQVTDLIHQMVESKEEYQEPGDGLLDLIKAAASHGKIAPTLRMVNYSGFYGKDLGDAGWGCGYRNAQMLIAALLKWPVTRQTLIQSMGMDKVPNIPKLQEFLSEAWLTGFDVYSAGELENEVVKTSKWIGTADVQSLFSSLRIDSRISDFCSAPGTTDVKEQLFQFLLDYFTFHTSNGSHFVPPIYIQYAGHSRTVIGMDITGYPTVPQSPCMDRKERDKWMDKVGLLIFDPGASQWDMAQPEKPTRKWYFDKILCKLSSFKEETYQILYFTGRILDDFHYDQMKVVGAGHHAGPFCLDED